MVTEVPRLGDRAAVSRAKICTACDRAGFHSPSCPTRSDVKTHD